MNTELRSFDAVLFDFADTLFDSRSALLPDVMAQHFSDLGMRAAPEDCERWIEQILAYVATLQGQARMQSCDYSPDLHRASWNAVVHACEGIPPAFAQPFYEVFCDAELLWRPFPDCEAVLDVPADVADDARRDSGDLERAQGPTVHVPIRENLKIPESHIN
ncbi:putative hydrolase [Candidatus Paraburkholderia kirkii UZHbot1]|uniref:Putative hydrolase n=1 Tax=Candidatus Paraburkholderia kirkii UZHbot1 TaxID=1055526 RepID=G4ME18_9BURK|nr:putative hydrolase [Candidatus Paraburkholderia kirkii UZHbot1]